MDGCMETPTNHRGIIALWPTIKELHADLDGREDSPAYTTVLSWNASNNIPIDHYPAVVMAATKRGYGIVTQQFLTDTRKRRKPRVSK